MNRNLSRTVLLVFLAAASAWAQMNVPPGPEVKKLDYFVGTWTTEGSIGQGPWGMGGKYSSTGTAQWSLGNYFVEIHRDFTMPAEVGGEGKEVGYMGYDTEENAYTFDIFNNQGRRQVWKGTVSGDTWTWTGSASYAGQDIQQKITTKVLSPTSHTVKIEISLDGKDWMTFLDGKATKK
jgi:hypothetical protein